MPQCPYCRLTWKAPADPEEGECRAALAAPMFGYCPASGLDHEPGRLKSAAGSDLHASPNGWSLPVGISLQEMENQLIAATLQHTKGNVKAAAQILKIDRSTLYDKIKRYRITRP